ncbi:hypothetical protein P4H66_05170 [Paenibacillus dokdonensis]|uniref:Uncharacterized protein n=1 Tax=Paenibacillus dokdonensis TaxID=2567944 RepID=A0ABU6GLX4_9BACL|nr:hypothetical protein [Paenibacillus dokdonensis]MEC0239246.1 hypothetical protein [Paenibacillus dokdonensis]
MDDLSFNGVIEATLYDGDNIVESYYDENLITDKGLTYISIMIGGDIVGGINKLGLGTVNTPPKYTDNKLYD